MDWFQIGKGVRQGCILSPCLFNLYAEYIMRNTGLEEVQAGIKIADDTTLMAESEEGLKSLLMKVKEESETVGLKLKVIKLINVEPTLAPRQAALLDKHHPASHRVWRPLSAIAEMTE